MERFHWSLDEIKEMDIPAFIEIHKMLYDAIRREQKALKKARRRKR